MATANKENNNLISSVLVEKSIEEVWKHWTSTESIKIWNVPFDNWHCPVAENEVQENGKFFFRMESQDGKDGFDYSGIYNEIIPMESIKSITEDGRKNWVEFKKIGNQTLIQETFEPDSITPLDVQQIFTDSILKKFKSFIEQV